MLHRKAEGKAEAVVGPSTSVPPIVSRSLHKSAIGPRGCKSGSESYIFGLRCELSFTRTGRGI